MQVFAANYPPAVLALLDRIALHILTGEVKTCGHDFAPSLPVVLGSRPNTLLCTECADVAEAADYPTGTCETCHNYVIPNACAALLVRAGHCLLRLNVCAACHHGIRLENS